MDSDTSNIPIEPIPFSHPLSSFSEALAGNRATIVAIGSSSTAGEGSIPPYPERLLALLRRDYPQAVVAMKNQGIGGQEALEEFKRFDVDVIPEEPDLVIWQVETNAVWQSPDAHPASIEETIDAIRDGLVRLREKTRADIVLMDLQYVPAVLTPAKEIKAIAMVDAIGRLARAASANVFRRFAFMKGLHEIERISFDRMVDPTDIDRLHQSDWVTERVTWAMRQAMIDAVEAARPS